MPASFARNLRFIFALPIVVQTARHPKSSRRFDVIQGNLLGTTERSGRIDAGWSHKLKRGQRPYCDRLNRQAREDGSFDMQTVSRHERKRPGPAWFMRTTKRELSPGRSPEM